VEKRMFFWLIMILPLSASCSGRMARPHEQIMAEIEPILKVEQRADRVRTKTQLLGLIGGIRSDQAKELKSHYDVYYVHYLAASVNLAGGDITTYKAHLKIADKELDAMEKILKNGKSESEEEPPNWSPHWIPRQRMY
jgi:hypothetical protein